ncbi:MAG: DNA polymerase I [Rhodobacteraceae bacterium]|nr:DNA polymerase I [Paracoccaceae bacterium]
MESNFGKGCHLHLIDGSAFIFRAYHALPPLTRASDGLPVGAVSGFCNMLQRYVETHTASEAPTHVAVIFDHSGRSFRNDIYPLYKANRPPPPPDLVPQFPLTREATRAFNIACCEVEGYEADDIIATLACRARDAGGRVSILGSDKDLMQLVGNGVELQDPMKNRRIDRDGVREKFGVWPEQVIDVQALAGDSVDNIPGAPGIGIKTAAQLVNAYGSLEALLEQAAQISQPKRREALTKNRALIEISRRLVTLDSNMALDMTLEETEVRPPDPACLLGFLAKMEFRTLARRISERLGVEPPVIKAAATAQQSAGPARAAPIDPTRYEWVKDAQGLQGWIAKAEAQGYVAVDTETTGLDEMRADLVGVSLCTAPGAACYVPLGHKKGDSTDLFADNALAPDQMDAQLALTMLKPLLEDASILKVFQNAKYDCKILARQGIAIAPVDDTMLMSYVLHAGLHGHGMDTLSERYLDHSPIPIKSLLGSGKSARSFDRVPIAQAVPYAAEDAEITLRLWQKFRPSLPLAQATNVYETLERPLIAVLADMEQHGTLVDRATLKDMSHLLADRMAELEAKIHRLAGTVFNVGSPKQLGEILFGRLKLAPGKKGKTGAYATGATILEDLAATHELPAMVLDWRQLSKLKSTYTDALPEHINPKTGRVHTSYVQSGANTGRLASTDPNLQNIPVRTEEGRRIRKAFVAAKGQVWLSLDYSQIELRILAHIAKIDALKQAFRQGHDIHAMTASEVFGTPLEDMDAETRRKAKAINFGVIYGISAYGLARNLRIPRAEAQDFIDRYFARFPGIRQYMEQTREFAKKHGYVQTLFGRRIHTPEINARGPGAGFAYRAAINAPIQGTAADIIRRAMIRMPKAMAGLPAKMLLQVHDELIFEVATEALEDTIAVAREVMQTAPLPAVQLDVPLVVDAGSGANWDEAH